MTKALPWNTNRLGLDARDSAREAARRQGKSIGEWLHGVIADHATELGVAERDVASQDRVDIIATKLRSMSARHHDGQKAADLRDEPAVAVATRRESRSDDGPEPHGRHPERSNAEDADDRLEADYLLEEAVDAMERRALRAERRTSAALSSFAKMLESSEEKRERERHSIVELAQKLSTIETTLVDRTKAVDENPIKGSLARLEARLEMIGRRSAAEARLRAPAPKDEAAAKSDPMRQLEDKLNSILRAVSSQVQPAVAASDAGAPASIGPIARAPTARAPIAQAAPQGVPMEAASPKSAPLSPRRFHDAVSEIAKRQQSLDELSSRDQMPPMVDHRDDVKRAGASRAMVRRPLPLPFETMQGEMAGLAKAVEEMRRELLRGRELPDRHASDLAILRADIGAMSRSLDEFAPLGSIVALEETIKAVADRIETSRDSGVREAVLRPIETMVGDLRRAMGELDQRPAIGGLETQVRAIAGKIGNLEDAGDATATALSGIQDEVGTLRRAVTHLDPRQGLGGLETGLRALADKIEHLERGGIAAAALASIQEQVDEIRGLVSATAKRHVAIEQIEDRVATMVERVERQALAKNAPVKPDAFQLEGLIRDLGRKIEAVQAPDADNRAIEALQAQVGLLAARFEKTESGLPVLATIERSMRDLFAHLEDTRANVETAAAGAAREVLRIAADENRAKGVPTHARDIASLRAMQDEADARTSLTLNAVHETLEKVVDRLSSMETDLEDVRARPTRPVLGGQPTPPTLKTPTLKTPTLKTPTLMTRSSDDRRAALQMSLGAPDPLRDAAFDRTPSLRPAKSQAMPPPPSQPIGGRGNPTDLDDEAGRADFIAAARRAAQAAQTDPSVLAMKRPGIAAGNVTRAGLLARSRDYVASHKKPVLLGFAALFVIIGTMAIMQRMGLSPEEMIADRAAPAKIATLAAAPTTRFETAANTAASGSATKDAGVATSTDELSPSAMPKASLADQISGSDPIQTGSIPSLPAFAAQTPGNAPRTSLPSGLKTAAEAGDAAAEYELGSRYAEGHTVPRDMKIAAKWYDKAAAQGIVPAQYRLASLYEKGLGVAQDKEKARGLYQQAADSGNPRAMHNLAVMLADGDGKPDYDGAAIWFRKAAQYGVHDSQFNLAILLARGLGVSASLVQSYQWFAIAAAQNDADAAKKRDEVGLKLSANDVAVAKALAAAFHPRIANPSAMDVRAPADGWDGAAQPSHLNSARAKISSL